MKTIPALFTNINSGFVPTSIFTFSKTTGINDSFQLFHLQGFALKPSKIDVVEINYSKTCLKRPLKN